MKIVTGGITAPRGFSAQGVCAHIKNATKKDVGIIYSENLCAAAGVFTTNKVRAACVDLDQAHLAGGQAQAIVVNSGNANACTGLQGQADARTMADLAGEYLNLPAISVVVASTGVIGVQMPMDRVRVGIQEACSTLSNTGAPAFAEAIMTTDLIPKEIAVEFEIQGKPVKMGAVAKGSGMIHPNMATMLAFITTDAAIHPDCLQQLLKQSADCTYNMISVDRDTSTNDMAIILANGQAGNEPIHDLAGKDGLIFKEALDYVNTYLAKKIARDGEGATHLIEVQVVNAPGDREARMIARSITTSNLIKAAVFGGDANWGRILCAAGYSGADFDPYRVNIYLGDVQVAENGMGLRFDEVKARQELEKDTVRIAVDLQSGVSAATAWGCDLSYDYVKINADYRT